MTENFTVTYELDGDDDVHKLAFDIIYGQSIGNPDIRSEYEKSSNIQSCKAQLVEIKGNIVKIEFPKKLFIWPNISQLLCIIQGGQSDIKRIKKCRILEIENLFSPIQNNFGLNWLKKKTNSQNRPLFGTIVKPKAGLNSEQLIQIVEQMIDGGVDFIKEDEIMADNEYLPLSLRVELIDNLINKKNANCIYTACINDNPSNLIKNLDMIAKSSLGVHINFWSGLGSYCESQKKGIFNHFQRSGIRILTNQSNPFGIEWSVIVKLATWSGIDSIHLGMLGGYYPDDEPDEHLIKLIEFCTQNNVIPALSCGMTPDIAKEIKNKIGNNFLANVGGWLHSTGDIYSRANEFRKSLE